MTHAHSASFPAPADIWPQIRAAAEVLQQKEPVLAILLQNNVRTEATLGAALCRILSGKLASAEVGASTLYKTFAEAGGLLDAAAPHDLIAILKNDPAAHDLITPFLFFKGFHALQTHRLAHELWGQGRTHLALYLQNRAGDVFGVDIHPAAKIGQGIMMDHATGIVIGETAVVEDGVLFWHNVTLGGKGKGAGDRHPKVRKNAWLGAGSTLLGPIEIGENARVAAGSIVIESVPANTTVAGAAAQKK